MTARGKPPPDDPSADEALPTLIRPRPGLQVVSRKAADAAAGKLAASGPREQTAPVPKLRAISEISDTPPYGMGRLAPPRDAREVRSRRVRDVVIWCAAAAALATLVSLLIWFVAA